MTPPVHASWEVLIVDAPDLPAALEVSRPEVLVVSTSPGADPTLVGGYRLVLDDGAQHVLLREDATQQVESPSEPAGDLTSTTARERALAEEVASWRARALSAWEEQAAAGPASGGITDLLAMRQSLSWRVTRPLRSVRSRLGG